MTSDLQIYDDMKREIAEIDDLASVIEHNSKAEALRAYHQKQNADLEMQNYFGEMVGRGKRRQGQLIKQAKEEGALEDGKGGQNKKAGSHRGTPLLKLGDLGINKNESSRSQKMADIPEDIFDKKIETMKTEGKQITNAAILKIAHVGHNSGENEWYTPVEYIEAARAVMGGIDLDPASSDIANETVKATMYYTEESDGLAWDWNGRVWMNPPYAQPLITYFCDKLTTDLDNGFITDAITLTNNATETKWFRGMSARCAALCLVGPGRIKFIDKEGNPGGAPLQGQAILYFGKQAEKFAAIFDKLGQVFYATG